jgi:Lon protease-like protein
MPETPTYGLFVLGLVLVPGERVPLHIFEPRYRQLFADCVLDDTPFVVLYSEDDARAPVGCTARFEELLERHEDGRISVVVAGIDPVEILHETNGRLYDCAGCRPLVDDPVTVDSELRDVASTRFRALAEAATGQASEPEATADVPWSFVLAAHLELAPRVKQALLESRDENIRLRLVADTLELELAAAERSRLAAERAPTNGKVPHD